MLSGGETSIQYTVYKTWDERCVCVLFPSLTAVTSSKMTCFEGLSCTTLSQLQSVARLAYQGTLNDQLIFHDVQDNIEPLGMPNVLHVSVSMTCIW